MPEGVGGPTGEKALVTAIDLANCKSSSLYQQISSLCFS